MKRAITILVILAVVGGIGWKVYQKYSAKRSEAKKGIASVAVEVAPVRQATMREIIQPSGDLVARSEFVVAPKVAGRLVKLLADLGDTVSNGQLIAVLDDAEYNQQVAQSEAELEVVKAAVEEARSTLDAAQREFDRVEALRGKKIASESELDESRSQYRTALARNKVAQSLVTQKEAALEAAKVRQSYTQIQARWTTGGEERMVGERFADAGAMLAANDKILSVVDIDVLTAVIHVTEREYGNIKVGQTVGISCNDAYPGRVFPGEVLRVAPLIKQTSREARVEIQVKNAERLLRPGMFILAQIELSRHEGATVVPDAALVRRDEKPAVFLADRQGKKAKLVKVQPGFREGQLVEIVSPALEGPVITIGQHQLEDGTAISISNESPVAGGAPAAATQAAEAGASKAKAEAKS
jgi:RND family efflux transporter MFP subunit